MATCNKYLFTLLSAAFLLFTNTSSWCQTSASSMGFSTSSDTYGEACDVFGLGVTYGGGLGAPFISYDLLPGYSGGTSIGGMATYEHLFSKKLGLGLAASYSNASYNAVINYPAGVSYPAGTVNDTKKGGYIGLGGRFIYHFSGHRLEPYIGAVSGITLTSLYSETYSPGNPTVFTGRVLFGGVLIGILAGIEYHASNYFSVKLECNYSGVPNYLGGISLNYRIYNRY